MFENLFTPKYSEKWYRDLTAKEFYRERNRKFPDGSTTKLAPLSDPEFRALPTETRKQIWAAKFGLDSATFWAMPIGQRNALIDASQGRTYIAGLDTGIDAAQADARGAAVRGFIKGFGTTGTIVAVLGLALTVYINRDKLGKISK